jgi:Cys-tRNA synthase (O-phospho-L-seryl-tRNA:Cys-tRNA synthase)
VRVCVCVCVYNPPAIDLVPLGPMGEADMTVGSVVHLLLHCCYTVVPLLLHCCYTVVTLLLHCRHNVIKLLLHGSGHDSGQYGPPVCVGE